MDMLILPPVVTYDSVARLRIIAEQRDDPELYELVAKGFDALIMPSAAASMRERRDYYLRFGQSQNERS